MAVSRTRADLDSLVREVGADSSQPSRQRVAPGVGRDARRQVRGLTKDPQQTLAGRADSVGPRVADRMATSLGLEGGRNGCLACLGQRLRRREEMGFREAVPGSWS